MRHILHADLDAFYASVEQLDNPELRGKPVLVGGLPEDRGVVATASYEARRFGVHSAMPMRSAVRRCPQGIIVRPRFGRYREISGMVMEVFRDLTELIEPLSLDEAYLDFTEAVEAGKPALAVALDLKQRVHQDTGLILSVGVATNKSVAKIASDLNKPDGLVVVLPGEETEFLAPLRVGKLYGIGPKTAKRLEKEGIETIGQLAAQPLAWFTHSFGQRAAAVRAKALGEDQDPVYTARETKSVSSENTFSSDLAEPDRLREELSRLAINVARHLESQGLQGKTVTLKARLADFTIFTRQVTLPSPTASERTILDYAWRLLSLEMKPDRSFRLLGVGVSSFHQAPQFQLPLFGEPDQAEHIT
jgi:DNA polymerase-4